MKINSLMLRRQRLALLGAGLLILNGCSSFSADGGFSQVEQWSKARLGKDVQWLRNDTDRKNSEARVAQLLEKPLSVDDAVQVALLNNQGLQAAFYELAIAEADAVQAGRLPNPGLSVLRANNGGDFKIEQILSLNILSLVTMPQAAAIERGRFERTQRTTTIDVLQLAAETRKAYFMAVAADETVRYQQQVKQLADASADLARRMLAAGNWSRLAQAREQGFYADAVVNLTRAEQMQLSAHEQLTRLLGLSGSAQFQLPLRLPDLPERTTELPDIEQQAMTQRLDLQAMRLDTDALAKSLNLTQSTRFVNVFEIGAARVLEGKRDDPYKKGYELRFEIPIFDSGDARIAKAEALYRQALNRVAEAAVNARSEVREAYGHYQKSFELVKHVRDEVMTTRQKILVESQLRYNGNLIGTFDLLADAGSQIESMNSYIEALRDFWLAQSQLDMVMNGSTNMMTNP